jgi:hypothetical protein
MPISKDGGVLLPPAAAMTSSTPRTSPLRAVSDRAERRLSASIVVKNTIKFVHCTNGLLALVAAAMPLTGCSDHPAPGVKGRVIPTYRADTRRLDKLAYDRNGDGREDAWAFMNGARLLRAELDDNFDGRVDRRELYAAGASDERAGGTAVIPGQGVLTRVELVSATTGTAFREETYEKGVLAAAQEDTDGDARTDKWERYEDGALASVALDTRHRGTPDRRLVYRRDGVAPRIETDPDGDGHFGPAAPQ